MKKNSVMRGAIVSALFAVSIIQPVALGRSYAKSDASVEKASVGAIDDPEAVYQGARIVHNVTVKGEKGMRVHAKFTVKHGYDVSCKMIAYFYYDDSDNTPLKAVMRATGRKPGMSRPKRTLHRRLTRRFTTTCKSSSRMTRSTWRAGKCTT